MEKRRKVLVGTPCFDGTIDVRYAHAIWQSMRLAEKSGIDITPVFMSFDSLVQRARNDLVRLALEDEFDDLFFIDSDMQWEPEWALAILEHDVDVVGATYRKKTDDEEIYTVHAKFPIPADSRTGLWIVQGLGTGFLRFSRKALQALWDASEEYQNEGKSCRWIFDVCPVDGRLLGEDIIACKKLGELGFTVYLDPTFTPIHIGRKRYYGDFASYCSILRKKAA